MFPYLILLFTVLPALELAVLIHVGSHIGAANTVLVIILTGVSGAYLARLQGFIVIRDIQSRLEQGQMPTEQMIDGVLILVGGLLLLTPGFITDCLGILLLIPLTRSLIKIWTRRKMEFQIFGRSNNPSQNPKTPSRSIEDIEDAQFHE